MEYRKQLLLKELLGYNADVLCLQEVDEKIFKHDLGPVLGANGLQGIHDKKGGQGRKEQSQTIAISLREINQSFLFYHYF